MSEIREELTQRLYYEKLDVLQKAETCEQFLDQSDEGCPSVRGFCDWLAEGLEGNNRSGHFGKESDYYYVFS